MAASYPEQENESFRAAVPYRSPLLPVVPHGGPPLPVYPVPPPPRRSLRGVRQRLWVIAPVLAISLAGAIAATHLMTPCWRAHAQLVVLPRSGGPGSARGVADPS